jgi:hypothetical protein
MPPMTLDMQACKSLSATRTECCRCRPPPPPTPPPPLPSSSFHSLIIPITTSMMPLPHAAAPPVRHPPFNRREIRHVLGGHARRFTCRVCHVLGNVCQQVLFAINTPLLLDSLRVYPPPPITTTPSPSNAVCCRARYAGMLLCVAPGLETVNCRC